MGAEMTAYYNEHDPYAAQMLRNLIAAGHIAPGVVDERDIRDVRPEELREYVQCHFFAGVGVWSLALRRAGWPDDRPVWTGSCPCQPFSAAGRGDGFIDERHLWPHWYHLITQRNPDRVYGEQVSSKDGLAWLDLVQADMEGAGYAFGAVDLCAAGVGAPHIRQRSWFVAQRMGDALCAGLERLGDGSSPEEMRGGTLRPVTPASEPIGMANSHDDRQQSSIDRRSRSQSPREGDDSLGCCAAGGMANPQRDGSHRTEGNATKQGGNKQTDGIPIRGGEGLRGADRAGPTNGFWRDVDWLFCRDGKWRPVEPGTFPLVNGAPSRVGRLRAYGNAINAEAAQVFIEATL